MDRLYDAYISGVTLPNKDLVALHIQLTEAINKLAALRTLAVRSALRMMEDDANRIQNSLEARDIAYYKNKDSGHVVMAEYDLKGNLTIHKSEDGQSGKIQLFHLGRNLSSSEALPIVKGVAESLANNTKLLCVPAPNRYTYMEKMFPIVWEKKTGTKFNSLSELTTIIGLVDNNVHMLLSKLKEFGVSNFHTMLCYSLMIAEQQGVGRALGVVDILNFYYTDRVRSLIIEAEKEIGKDL